MLSIFLVFVAFVLFTQKRYKSSLIIFLSLITNGFQIIPAYILMVGAPVEKTTDVALFYILAVSIYSYKKIILIIRNESLYKWIIVFSSFVFIDLLYSIIIQKYEIVGAIKVFRNYLYWLSFVVAVLIPVKDLHKVFHIISIITLLQCCLYLAQIPTGLTLLQTGMSGGMVTVGDASETGIMRYYNSPIFLTPVLFYFMFQYHFQHWSKKVLILSLLALAVFAPLHRNYIFSTFIITSLYILAKQQSNKRILYFSVTIIFCYVISLISVISNRLNTGINDFSTTLSTGKSGKVINGSDNTFSFRIAHFVERYNYVTKTTSGYIFGVGFLSENSKQAKRLSFENGTFNKFTQETAQIDTSDIAWSLLIMHLGLLGTFIFIVIIINIIKLFYKNRNIAFSVVGLLSILSILLTSFASIELLSIPFRVIILLITVTVVKNIKKENLYRRSFYNKADLDNLTVKYRNFVEN